MLIGAQLFTVREFTQNEKDLYETFGKLQEMGYRFIQVSAVGDIDAATIRKAADEHSLKIILTHTSPNLILNETQKVVENHRILGANYVGIGAMPSEYRNSKDGVLAFIKNFKNAAKVIAQSGLKFMYHNHAFEFEKYDEKYCLEYLAQGFTPEEMGFIIDTYWVSFAGCDPAMWIKKLSGRCDTIHFKDLVFKENTHFMSEVMEGNLNWDEIFRACSLANVSYAFVEQDNCYGKNPFDCLKLSLNNLREVNVGE